MVTILLLNYKREANLPGIIESLRSQTVPCEIFLWNNAEKPFENPDVDWIVNSSRNVRCWSRWSMAPFASYKYVMTLDDDICFTSFDCLEILVDELETHYKHGRAIGTHGVVLDGDCNYYPRGISQSLRKVGIKLAPRHFKFPEANMEVDILKGRLIFCKKNDLAKVPLYPLDNKSLTSGDDIVVSSYLAGRKRKQHMITNRLNGKMKELWGGTEPMALSTDPEWEELRNQIAKMYFDRA